jgi:C4-type Zn-finger protein
MNDDELMRGAPRCPVCEATLAWEWFPAEPHEYCGTIVYEAEYSVSYCPVCDWREDA